MRAMILAAGRGERLGELTTLVPKPLLRVGDLLLIEYPLYSLRRAGITEVVINISYHAEQIKCALNDGKRYGMKIIYSEEAERLETGGGILKALPLLGSDPFIVISSDIVTDYPIEKLPREFEGLAHLVMVKNPHFHPEGDFGLGDGKLSMEITPKLTFANIGIYHPALFDSCEPGHFPLNRLLFPAVRKGLISGEHYQGEWHNIGTKDDFASLQSRALEDSTVRAFATET